MDTNSNQERNGWDWEIQPRSQWWGISIRELISYKDLLVQLTRKEFLGLYQQTLIGPFWALVQPLITVITFVFVFNNLIGVSTQGVPPFLFNLIGITLWNLFSEIFLQTSKTFLQNADIFSKVYFPRIIVALSALLLQLLLFGIQLLFLGIVYTYFVLQGAVHFNLMDALWIFPVVIVTSGIGFGAGLIFAVLTAKYRDLQAVVQLILRLLMFVCPIFFSLQLVPAKLQWFVNLNPLSAMFEYFRYAFLGFATIGFGQFIYSFCFMMILVALGILIFNKLSDHLMDVI